MPTEARGNYLPGPPYLRETKTYHSQPLESLDTTYWQLFRPDINAAHFFVAEVMSNYLTTDGLKKIFSTSGGPLRPGARGICHICHVVNPALPVTMSCRSLRLSAESRDKETGVCDYAFVVNLWHLAFL